MWEFFIETNLNDVGYLYKIEKFLKAKNFNVITAIYNNSLSVACNYNIKPKVCQCLKQIIAESVVLIYKERFFSQNLNLSFLQNNLKQSLIKCLVLFDFEEDYAFVISKLELNNAIVFDSFYKFMLKNLQLKWKQEKLIFETNTSIINSNTFLDLLKFLISTLKPKHNSIDVYFNGKNFVLSDENNNILKFNNSTLQNIEVNLICELINLSPKTINLHCAGMLTNSTFKIIYYIFNKKVNLIV